MGRVYKHDWVNSQTRNLLDLLVDETTSPEKYKDTMYKLGQSLGDILLQQFNVSGKKVSIACTVEDADFLAKGIMDCIETKSKNAYLTVFWNKRFTPNEENKITVAPILREFHDVGYKNADILIVLKSIISSACIVKTNLTKLIQESTPDNIYIVAPVLLKDAQKNLEDEFPVDISSQFEYIYFAVDDEKNKAGMVVPGIGGDVYKRLGFNGQESKNEFTPHIVRERRNNKPKMEYEIS